ncbi:MAG: hypothetical protein M0Z94_09645 [Dehalococcoidales bacterium]|nr:hypothetical protein [Dehalococcoidales bacterium]
MRTRAWSRKAGWLGVSILLSGVVLFTGCPQVGGSLSEGPGSRDVITRTTTRMVQAPNFANYGFTNVLGSKDLQANSPGVVTGGPYTVSVPAGAFANPVKFEILEAPLSVVQPGAPPNEQPVLDLAFRVTDMTTGELIGTFGQPVTLTARNAMITAQSQYWNYTPAGNYILNPTGLQVQDGELRHRVNTAIVAWVITNPMSTTTTTSAMTRTGTSTMTAPTGTPTGVGDELTPDVDTGAHG